MLEECGRIGGGSGGRKGRKLGGDALSREAVNGLLGWKVELYNRTSCLAAPLGYRVQSLLYIHILDLEAPKWPSKTKRPYTARASCTQRCDAAHPTSVRF